MLSLWGVGHSYKQCPSQGGIDWRTLNGAEAPPSPEKPSGWGMEGSHYHNPDPLCRLIGPKNEVKVIVNDEQVTALVDSRAQISAVSMAFAKCHGLPIWQL